MQGAIVELNVLGPLKLVVDGEEVPLGSAKCRRLLAVLACHANRPVTADELTAILWRAPPPSAADNLRQYVYRLRRTIGDRIGRDGQGYLLVVHDGELDAHRFEELVAEGDRAFTAEDPERTDRVLGEALALWRGPAYPDLADVETVRPAVRRLEESRLLAVERRMEAALAIGRHEEILPELASLVARHPLRERLRGLWMLALHRAGRRSEALEAYRQGSRALATELGLEPGAYLRQLERTIRSAGPAPAELPPDNPAFTGRAAELTRLCDLLTGEDRDSPAVCGIWGPGGAGKSALAIHVAHRVADRYPDGQLYVDLRGAAPDGAPLEPTAVLARLLRSLGMDGPAIPAEIDEAGARFRSIAVRKRLLLVLDNAVDAAQVRPLLPAGALCGVLVTCRQALRDLEGAVTERIGVLPEPEALDLLNRLIGPGRAAAEPEAAAEVVRMCDRLPLAVCLAAARLAARPAWTLGVLADRLEAEAARLSALEADDRGVRASFHVGYRGLDPAARRMFRLAGLVDGVDLGMPVAAALAGLSRREAADLLDRLEEAQLVEAAGPVRYRLHDLLRLFARERAAEEESDADRVRAVRRALGAYLGAARAATVAISPRAAWRTEIGARPPDDPAPGPAPGPASGIGRREEAYAWIDAEIGNLPHVVSQAESEEGPVTAVALAAALHRPLSLRGYMRELHTVGGVAVAAAGRTGDPIHESVAHEMTGEALAHVGRLADALSHLHRAVAAARAAGNRRAEASQLSALMFTHRMTGELDAAAGRGRESRELHRALGDRVGEGIVLNNLGLVYRRAERYGDAVSAHAAAAEIAADAGNHVGRSTALGNLAEAHRHAGRPREAARLFLEALAVDRACGHAGSYGEAERWWGLGTAHHDLGEADRARECRRRAAAILGDLGLISHDEKEYIDGAEFPETPEIILRNL